ncbi:hypothetical protein [Pseudomonas sp. GL-B-19]|uniref:hypothetical protein n=1 Tax=Pseudomonas sp. GL-B-19 TaxID=2832393 RepID=UPI001CBF1CCA|nr:hypothetical protein [Pseudomonas sp. GL-B-19]
MRAPDFKTSVMGRRGFLQAFALLSLGGLMYGISKADARPPAVKSDFVVINGWVLPAQYFRQTQA